MAAISTTAEITAMAAAVACIRMKEDLGPTMAAEGKAVQGTAAVACLLHFMIRRSKSAIDPAPQDRQDEVGQHT
jgi:hypothetical protein